MKKDYQDDEKTIEKQSMDSRNGFNRDSIDGIFE